MRNSLDSSDEGVQSRPDNEHITQSTSSWPSIVFGDERTVKRDLRAIARKAFKAGSWEAVCANLEMKADDGSQDLLIDACHKLPPLPGTSYFIPATEPQWRFYLFLDAINTAARGDKTIRRDLYVRMKIAGMNYLWFTIGMLAESAGALAYMPLTQSEYRIASCDLLGKVVSWIPQLICLDGRLFSYRIYCKRVFDESSLDWARQQTDPKMFEGMLRTKLVYMAPNWAQAVLGLACGAGWEWDFDRVYRTYHADIVRVFLDDHIIEPIATGYKLTGAFVAKARMLS